MLGSRSAPASFENDNDQKNFITAEFSRLCQEPVDGIYICPLLKNPLEWKGIIMVRAGCYSGGTFRFSLYLPKNFPQTNELPIIKFDIYIFHPYIDPITQELNLSSCFPNLLWKREKNRIIDVLYYLQEIFAILTEKFPLDSRSVVNKQAALLFIKDFDNFRLKAEEFVAMSRHTVYDSPKDCNDPHMIIFPPYESTKMEPIRLKLLGKIDITTTIPIITNETNNCSRTISDFSSKCNTSNFDGDCDDEQHDDDILSNESNNSFEEINLEIEEKNDLITNSDGMSSIDLESAPISSRIDGLNDEKLNEEKNDGINDEKNEIEQEFAMLDMQEINPLAEEDQFSTNNNFTKTTNDNVKFKVGYSSSSSGPESIDEHDTLNMHQKLQHSISIEPISESSCNIVLENEPLKTETSKGVNARSISLFNDVLQ